MVLALPNRNIESLISSLVSASRKMNVRGFLLSMNYIDLSGRPTIKTLNVSENEFNPRTDLRGKKFGRLTVLDFDHKTGRRYYYKCICDCGKECIKYAHYLTSSKNHYKSCGCWHLEVTIKVSTTHGRGKITDREYKTWIDIKNRCYNSSSPFYSLYGGRGIKVCDRWIHSFENFIADMGNIPEPKKKYSIDRIDTNGDYCPENCRWATQKEQCNNRRSNIKITYHGRTQTLMQWCEELGLNYSNTRYQYKRGKRTFEQIVEFYKKKGIIK